jgi:NAD(P)H-hydrate epimerase
MIPLATAAQMRAMDRETIDELGLPAALLMEHAGRAVADAVAARAGAGARVAVVCGPGNNGGDGFVCARWLRERGLDARVHLVRGRPRERAGEAALHLGVYERLGGPVVDGFDAAAAAAADVIVDAVLGTGLASPVVGPLADVLAVMDNAAATCIAVDVPSGLDADTGAVLGAAVHADVTVALGCAKLGLASWPGCERAGELIVADIGVPSRLAAKHGVRAFLVERADAEALVPRRGLGDHKGTHGHVVVAAGSAGKVGAALLATGGALRAGAGLVTLATPPAAAPHVLGRIPEAMHAVFDPEAPDLTVFEGKRALVWGPGMPTGAAAGATVRRLAASLPLPAVLDADALNHLAEKPEVLVDAPAPRVLTPHPGEAARLLGTGSDVVQADRVAAARKLAAATRAVVVLKGARSVVAAPDGRVTLNPTGNPGLGTGGTGDVLAGVIGALLAQGLPALEAARLGVYVHGLAGDLAAAARGTIGLVAGDLLAELPRALDNLSRAARQGVNSGRVPPATQS